MLKKTNQLSTNILKDIEQLSNTSLKVLLEEIINRIMRTERDIYLEHNNDYANGYIERGLGTPLGKLSISSPRTRDSEFRSQVLPDKYKRDIDERIDIMQSLITSHYNPNDIARALRDMGMSYSPDDMDKIKTDLLDKFRQWNKRPVPHDLVALYIDAYQSPINYDGSVQKTSTFTALGIDFNGKKDVYGIYTYKGRENKEFWLNVINDLNDRGLKRVMIVVTDDFRGITEPIKAMYPQARRQLCLVHLLRNARKNFSHEHYAFFKKAINRIKNVQSEDEGKELLETMLNTLEPFYGQYIDYLRNNSDYYTAFLLFPEDIRFAFYTTNSVESFNSVLEKIRIQKGGFFQSENILNINIYIRYINMMKKWKNGYPKLMAKLYYLRQLFVKFYGELPYDN